MFDISWTEFLLIGVVALIVIGPKELPTVMRTFGQYTRKIRGMAADFQNQFQEAMREADMIDLKKQVDDMASDIKNYDPLKDVRTGIESVGNDLEKSLGPPSQQKAVEQAPSEQAPVALTPDTNAAAAPALPEPGAAAPTTTSAAAVPVAADEPASPERTG